MAVLTPSTNPVRINAGGTITIDDGTNSFVVVLYEAGSLTEVLGGRESVEFTDRGAQQQPLEGDDVMSEIAVGFKKASSAGADEVIDAVLLVASTDGKKREFTVTIDCPDGRDVATGLRHTWTQCSIPAGGVRMPTNPQLDMVEVSFRSRNVKPVTARY